MSAERKSLWRDDSGAALLEFTAAASTFFIVLFGIVEFSNVYYQWNAATKAVQVGARLAAVSEPAVVGFRDITGLSADVLPGDAMPDYDFTCIAGATGCSTDALRAIVFGRCDPATETCVNGVRIACNFNSHPRNIGMCNVFPRVNAPTMISVRYDNTLLGYAGRPGGPVPTVTVSLRQLNYDFILLGAFLSTNSIPLPGFATTVTGEDLNAAWSSG